MIGSDRNASHNYSFPNNRITVHWTPAAPLRPSALRSLGALANVTANAGFVDELAAAAKTGSIAFRLRHLADPHYASCSCAAGDRRDFVDRSCGCHHRRDRCGCSGDSGLVHYDLPEET
jgi:nicotinate dehydrogenase subunit B